MKKLKFKDKVHYKNELEDEICDFGLTPIKIDKTYTYIHKNPFYRFFAWFTYRILATPICWVYIKLIRRIKFKNKSILKSYKKGGYFIYGNHTDQFSDGFSPSFITMPKKPYIICNADNVSMPFIGKLTRMWGALPLPEDIEATRKFNEAIERALEKNSPVLIYPEAHLWPYYTKIRPFSDKSFRYPVKYHKPVFTFTMVYKKPRHGKKPRQEIWVDGPFYADDSLEAKLARTKLRNQVYEAMTERAKLSNYEYLEYIKEEEK